MTSVEPPPLAVAEPPDGVGLGTKRASRFGHVTDQAGVADAQLGHERVFGQAAEEAMQGMGFGNRSRHNRALLTQSDTDRIENPGRWDRVASVPSKFYARSPDLINPRLATTGVGP